MSSTPAQPAAEQAHDHTIECYNVGGFLDCEVDNPVASEPQAVAPEHEETDEEYEERTRPRIVNPPERIWLQPGCDGEVGEIDWSELARNEVSWCWERIDNTDIEYVLASTASALAEAVDARFASVDAFALELLSAWLQDIRAHMDGCPATFSNNVAHDCACGLTERREQEIEKMRAECEVSPDVRGSTSIVVNILYLLKHDASIDLRWDHRSKEWELDILNVHMADPSLAAVCAAAREALAKHEGNGES